MRLYATSMIAVALGLPAPMLAQTVTRADLVGTWVRTEIVPGNGTTQPATTGKEFLVFQDDGTWKRVGTVKTPKGVESIMWRGAYRWILAGDSLLAGSAEQTEADIRETMLKGAVQKVMISNDTLYLGSYLNINNWNKAFPGKPYPWSDLPTKYARSTESAP